MCGIVGYKGKGDRGILEAMNAALRHRGPDDAGSFVQGDAGLAQSRLSIIDLSPAGHQPMGNEDGSVMIVFNGEIYNFAELRASLAARHDFKSKTDTEVIVHLYEEIGTEVFSRLQGMFAIAIFDAKRGQLILARDRMGKKPLYWGIHGGTFMFGSELKALIRHPSFKKEIDVSALNEYFLYEHVPTPHSIFRDTWKLEPGTFLVWDGAEAKKQAFWKPTFLPKEASFPDSLGKLDQALDAAVRDRLVADVPLGIFLSGGIDSSAIAYYAARANPGKVKTFSVGFGEASFDESAYARRVARHLGTDHREERLSVRDCIALVPEIGDLLDEPLADASIVPTYLLSKFTREHVTVALGGDGGDELFAGYDTFLAHRLAALYGMIPGPIRRGLVEPVIRRMPTSHVNMSLDFKAKKFVAGFDGDPAHRNERWLGAFDRSERQKLFLPQVWSRVAGENEFADTDRWLAGADSHDPWDMLALAYERTYMMDQILVKIDRASMMASLEVRTPFLDARVVELANHMPVGFKFKGLTRKYILKRLMQGRLPHDIIHRKKKGFGMPIGEWMKGELKPLVLDLLGRESLEAVGLFDAAYVERLLTEHFSGARDNRKQIWTLLVFVMWWRRWMK